jgi:hypothetical protein
MIIILILFFLAIHHVNSEYDELLAKTALNISQSTYCLNNSSNWNCATCSNKNEYEKLINLDNELIVIGYNTLYKSIFVSFRGSVNTQNWIANIHFSQIQPYNNTDISVEKGFYNLFTNLKPYVINGIQDVSKKYNTKDLLITGHSLGGALSTLLAFELLYVENIDMNIKLITFGCPRIGNHDFVSIFNSFSVYSNRITHYYDIVPHIPQQFLKYDHISKEIWYNEENNEYKLCDDKNNSEDPTCSNSCSPTHCTSTADHMNYMNITMGTIGDC